MRRFAFLIAILGLGILIALLLNEPVMVNDFDSLIVGQVVLIEGVVDEERNFGNGKLLIIDEMPVYCECKGKYSGLNIKIEGIIEKFPEDLRIRAFKVEILD